MEQFINFAYIIAAVLFIFGIKMLGSAGTARRGNLISSIGMLLAVVVTLMKGGLDYTWIIAGLIIGSAIGGLCAKKVQMTGMPELVALFNGFGGLASVLVGWAEFAKDPTFSGDGGKIVGVAVVLAILIGAITFTGSLVAYLKLSGKIGGAATVFPMQKIVNAGVLLSIVVIGILFVISPSAGLLYFLIALSCVLGVLGVIPIGGGDMPVVISFLNSCSGLAASAAGFVIFNNVLIVAGCLVGASGLILTVIMCKAMNRTLANVFFGGFGAIGAKQDIEGEMKAISTEDAFYVLEAAQSVVIVPGYGMAVAQAQHVTRELGEVLESNGTEVRYAIHPVAGRMPGHMNVLLAEADVPYEQLCEMDDVNPTMETVDVAIVVGANDVVNPAALEDEGCAIYGMPIINVHQARTVFALKRGQGAGFSGLVNTLFFRENCRMIYGDAKETLTNLVAQFKE
ncbi:MAG: NAD(P)(+) transhydrogenase (Re/Si-specific) subunit beta [Verrucomicrobiales bacterium]|nr:NAD(P)(+) transhydrogenase (Re/Si-specific) subunit beta [Verrucomicrobiales bacterium]